jgi:hypothetical protein
MSGADGGIPIVIYDGRHIPVPDKHFDLLVCNSVLEHVPPDQRAALAREMRRVAKAVFCQTPAYSFPLEPHFIMPFVHWLPRQLGYQLIKLSPWRILSRPSAATISLVLVGHEAAGAQGTAGALPGGRDFLGARAGVDQVVLRSLRLRPGAAQRFTLSL